LCLAGDNIHTAKHIARECGLLTPDGVAMEGPTFRSLPDTELLRQIPRLQVLARSSPEDKHRLVSLLQSQKEVVAVTGDGTNDAPALKEADVGLAMGISGTDVAKEASDIVILDDNFKSIVKAVQWGRCIFGNIRKFLQFQLTVNVVALTIAFLAAVTGKGEPLNVLQLLWVNLIMDSLAALALATENPTPDLLRHKPHGRHESLLSSPMKYHILVQSLYQVAWLLFLLFGLPELGMARYAAPCRVSCEEWEPGCRCIVAVPESAAATLQGSICRDHNEIEKHNHEVLRVQREAINSVLFNTFIFMQLFNEVSSRKVRGEINVFAGLLGNIIFFMVVTVTLAMQIVIMQTPLAVVFKVLPQSWQEWVFAICVGAGGMAVCLLSKLAARPFVGRATPAAAGGERRLPPEAEATSVKLHALVPLGRIEVPDGEEPAQPAA